MKGKNLGSTSKYLAQALIPTEVKYSPHDKTMTQQVLFQATVVNFLERFKIKPWFCKILHTLTLSPLLNTTLVSAGKLTFIHRPQQQMYQNLEAT